MQNSQDNPSQYHIPLKSINIDNEVQLAEALSKRLEEKHKQKVAAFGARLDSQNVQYARQAQEFTSRIQVQPIVSRPNYNKQPERNAFGAPYYNIKEIENKIVENRKVQIAIDQKHGQWLKATKALFITPKPAEAVYIEKEFVIGGNIVAEIFAKLGIQTAAEYRFGYTGQEDDKWILYTLEKDGSSVENSVSYIFTDDEFKKFFRGHRVPSGEGESHTVTTIIPEYQKRVVEKLYPTEQALVDLLSPGEPNVDTITKSDLDLAA